MFTKEHYEAIAEILTYAIQDADTDGNFPMDSLIEDFAHYFEQNDPNFDSQEFFNLIS